MMIITQWKIIFDAADACNAQREWTAKYSKAGQLFNEYSMHEVDMIQLTINWIQVFIMIIGVIMEIYILSESFYEILRMLKIREDLNCIHGLVKIDIK